MKTIKQTVARGKRLVVSDDKGIAQWEFHGPREVDREVPDNWTWELLDEKPGPTAEEIAKREAQQFISGTNEAMTELVESLVISLKKSGQLTDLPKETEDFLAERAKARVKVPYVPPRQTLADVGK